MSILHRDHIEYLKYFFEIFGDALLMTTDELHAVAKEIENTRGPNGCDWNNPVEKLSQDYEFAHRLLNDFNDEWMYTYDQLIRLHRIVNKNDHVKKMWDLFELDKNVFKPKGPQPKKIRRSK